MSGAAIFAVLIGLTTGGDSPPAPEPFGITHTAHPSPPGARIVDVVPGGRGARLGLRPGDIVLTVNDRTVEDGRMLHTALERVAAPCALEVLRDDEAVILVEAPDTPWIPGQPRLLFVQEDVRDRYVDACRHGDLPACLIAVEVDRPEELRSMLTLGCGNQKEVCRLGRAFAESLQDALHQDDREAGLAILRSQCRRRKEAACDRLYQWEDPPTLRRDCADGDAEACETLGSHGEEPPYAGNLTDVGNRLVFSGLGAALAASALWGGGASIELSSGDVGGRLGKFLLIGIAGIAYVAAFIISTIGGFYYTTGRAREAQRDPNASSFAPGAIAGAIAALAAAVLTIVFMVEDERNVGDRATPRVAAGPAVGAGVSQVLFLLGWGLAPKPPDVQVSASAVRTSQAGECAPVAVLTVRF